MSAVAEDADDPNERYVAACKALLRGRDQIEASRQALAELSTAVMHVPSRAKINRHLWDCERALGHVGPYFSEAGQDAFLDRRVFKGKRDGVFVEVGGYDGVTGSNCLFFEMFRGWTGLLVEPAPAYFAKAAAFRRATCIEVAVAGAPGEAEFLEITEGYRQMSGLTETYKSDALEQVEADPRFEGHLIRVRTRPLPEILDEHGLVEIDYISLDVEGAELAVLEHFPFDRYRIGAWSIENGSYLAEIPELMRARGYARVEAMGADEIYALAGMVS